MWKVTSSKRGKGSVEDLTEGSDDEYRNGLSDDLDYQIRRTYGVAASVAPKLPNLLGSFRCIACNPEAIATNLGISEACLGRRCLLPTDHACFASVREVERSRSPSVFALVRRCRVGFYLGDLVRAYVHADISNVQETLPSRDNKELAAPPAPTAEAGGKDREERQHIMVAVDGPTGCGKSTTTRTLQKKNIARAVCRALWSIKKCYLPARAAIASCAAKLSATTTR